MQILDQKGNDNSKPYLNWKTLNFIENEEDASYNSRRMEYMQKILKTYLFIIILYFGIYNSIFHLWLENKANLEQFEESGLSLKTLFFHLSTAIFCIFMYLLSKVQPKWLEICYTLCLIYICIISIEYFNIVSIKTNKPESWIFINGVTYSLLPLTHSFAKPRWYYSMFLILAQEIYLLCMNNFKNRWMRKRWNN